MSTHELNLTLVGWLGTEPRHYPGGGTTTPFTTFRMASTRRWFDREKGEWIDARTEWFTVKAWRGAARNVAESLRKGDPVVVHGRLSTDEWNGPDGSRTTLVLDAIAIGPDLTYGTARYARTVHTSGPGVESATAGDADEIDAGLDPAARADEPGGHLVLDDDLAPYDALADDERGDDPLLGDPLALSGPR